MRILNLGLAPIFLKFYRQADSADCGPTCLRMIARFHGKSLSARYLRDISFLDRKGVSLLGISHAAEQIGFRTLAAKIKYENQSQASLLSAPLPCIAHWNQNHFVVLYRVTEAYVWLADPASGKHKLKRSAFEKSWSTDGGKPYNRGRSYGAFRGGWAYRGVSGCQSTPHHQA